MKIRLKKPSEPQPQEQADIETQPAAEEPVEKKEKPSKSQEAKALLLDILFLITKIVIVCAFFFAVFTYLFGITRVTDMDMTSSIREGDIVVYNRLEKDYLWWECVVFEHDGETQVRRVVATAGDMVEVTEEGLKVNGYLQAEKYITEETRRYAEGIEFPVTLTEGQIFVLGDARFNATDSRIYGPVDSDETLGKVMMVIRRRDF